MATWIVHFRIAEKLIDQIPGLDAEQFAVGSIGPDSGIPDEDWINFNPPKEDTHYLAPGIEPDYRHQDMIFFHQYLQKEPWPKGDAKRFSFLLGYFFHLIVDNLWLPAIWRPTKRAHLSKFKDKFALGREVKKDWYGLDFAHVRSNPNAFFWKVFLKSAYPEPYLDFFPPEAIPRQLDYIKNFYQRVDKEIEENFRLSNNIFLTEGEVAEFVEESVQTLTKVYQLLWLQQNEIVANQSVLEILEGLDASSI